MLGWSASMSHRSSCVCLLSWDYSCISCVRFYKKISIFSKKYIAMKFVSLPSLSLPQDPPPHTHIHPTESIEKSMRLGMTTWNWVTYLEAYPLFSQWLPMSLHLGEDHVKFSHLQCLLTDTDTMLAFRDPQMINIQKTSVCDHGLWSSNYCIFNDTLISMT